MGLEETLERRRTIERMEERDTLVKSLLDLVNTQAEQIRSLKTAHEKLFKNQKNLLRMVLDIKEFLEKNKNSPIITLR